MEKILKKILIILALFILSVGVVSASDNVTDVTLEDAADASDELGNVESDVVGKTIKLSGGGTFSNISEKIGGAKDGDIISLSGTFNMENSYDNIYVDKSITIKGPAKKATLNGNNKGSMFHSSKNITFINIKFVKAKGYAISASGIVNIINCTFENNECPIYVNVVESGTQVGIDGCTFKNNKNHAIFSSDCDLTVKNCQFTNNDLNGIDECGGAIWASGGNVDILSSKFTNNDVKYWGGAIYISSTGSISNSVFTNNNAKRGSAVHACGVKLVDNVFINNTADEDLIEGAGYFDGCILVNDFIKNVDDGQNDVSLSITTLGNYIGDDIEIKLMDSKNSIPLTNRKITLYSCADVDVEQMIKSTDAGGIARFSPSFSIYRVYDLFAVAEVDGFKVVSALADVEFKDVHVAVRANDLVTTYNSGKLFTAQVVNKDTNKGIGNVELVFFIEGKGNYKARTDSNGVASIKLPLLNVGKHAVDIYVSGDYDFDQVYLTKSIKINKAPTKVKAPKVKVKAKKSKNFKVTVKAYGKPVNKLKLKLKVFTGKKSKIYTLKTNKKGIAKYNIKKMKLKKGKHNVVISSGNSNYKISAKSKITVK